MSNSNLYFVPKRGVWNFEEVPMVASVPMAEGAAIGIQISGNTTTGNKTLMGVENALGADFVGILQADITAGDADYATAGKLKLVAIPFDSRARAEFAVISGTFTQADEGKTVEFAAGSLGLAVDTPGKGARITKYLTSTRGECQFTLPTTETA